MGGKTAIFHDIPQRIRRPMLPPKRGRKLSWPAACRNVCYVDGSLDGEAFNAANMQCPYTLRVRGTHPTYEIFTKVIFPPSIILLSSYIKKGILWR